MCGAKEYRREVYRLLPELMVLDGKDKEGREVFEDESEGDGVDDVEGEDQGDSELEAEVEVEGRVGKRAAQDDIYDDSEDDEASPEESKRMRIIVIVEAPETKTKKSA